MVEPTATIGGGVPGGLISSRDVTRKECASSAGDLLHIGDIPHVGDAAILLIDDVSIPHLGKELIPPLGVGAKDTVRKRLRGGVIVHPISLVYLCLTAEIYIRTKVCCKEGMEKLLQFVGSAQLLHTEECVGNLCVEVPRHGPSPEEVEVGRQVVEVSPLVDRLIEVDLRLVGTCIGA